MKIPFPRVSFGLIVLLATLRSNALNAMETSTNIHWLTPNAEVSTAGGGTYYGAAGFEIITVSGADQIIVDGNVDKIVLGGFRNDYQKSIQGTRIQLTSDTQGGVTFSGLNNPVVLSFADGDYSLQLAALDWAFLGTEPLVDWGVGAALVASAVARSEATQVPAPASWENRLTSSSQLDLSWNTPTGSYDHIQLVLTNTQTGQVEYRTLPTNEIRTLSATESGYRATGLNSGTDYNINLRLCLASDCAQFKTSATVAAQTSEEYWWLQGTGNSASTVSKVIEDGNTKPFAFAMGKDAPSELQGLVQLYYNPMKSNGEKGQQIRIAATSMAGSEADPARYLALTRLDGDYGLVDPPQGDALFSSLATFQAVPLSPELGGNIRLFFEAAGGDGSNRIFSINSADSYTGRDFNSNGQQTLCQLDADYTASGPCALTQVLGVEGDGDYANANISHVRQFKIGYPQLTDWRWDGAVGTFMVFTVNAAEHCSSSSRTQGYAVYNGVRWQVQYDDNQCPRLFENMQAPLPLHLGGTRYKLYYSDTTRGGKGPGLPAPGPLVMLYADGRQTGPDDQVDFEDWSDMSVAREVNFIWPDGTLLENSQEMYLDDYVFFMPTGNPSLQILYANFTDGSFAPKIIGGWLLNP